MTTTYCFTQRARDHGATICEGEPMSEILVQDGCVMGVCTLSGELHTPIVVIAATVWSSSLAQDIGIKLPVLPTRYPMVALSPTEVIGAAQGYYPVVLDLMRHVYLRPDIDGMTLVGSAKKVLTPSNPNH
jgi:4-methylaminobutanoate oxidase (formaldehyde-forming)